MASNKKQTAKEIFKDMKQLDIRLVTSEQPDYYSAQNLHIMASFRHYLEFIYRLWFTC